jgi:hypothetical protein
LGAEASPIRRLELLRDQEEFQPGESSRRSASKIDKKVVGNLTNPSP